MRSLERRISIFLSIGIIFIYPTFIFAQIQSQTTTITLQEVALQAPKTKTVQSTLPFSLSTKDLSSFQAIYQQLSLQEYLGSIPGLFTQNANNYAQDLRISLRGFGSRAAFGIRGVKIIIDGIPETTPDGQGQLDNLPLGLLKSFEVLNSYNPSKPSNIDDVIEIDKLARIKSLDFIKRLN